MSSTLVHTNELSSTPGYTTTNHVNKLLRMIPSVFNNNLILGLLNKFGRANQQFTTINKTLLKLCDIFQMEAIS
jgi:hypothetical protein